MTTPANLRSQVTDLSHLAAEDLAAIWAQITADEVPQVLPEVIPPLVGEYSDASAVVSADWYDEYRDTRGVDGGFRADVPPATAQGADALAGWGASLTAGEAVDLDAVLVRITGGLQRRIADASRQTITDNTFRDPKARGWQRVARPDGCGFCQMLAGRAELYRSQGTADFSSHDHCFPAGVLVTGPSVELGFRRWYKGEVVILRFAGGQELPVTPNHPILTRRGWVPAGGLRVGEDVFERTGADLAELQVPHEDDVPSRIEDVWGAARMNRFRTVPVSAEDFHGDAGAGQHDVDVVSANSFLTDVRNTLPVQHFAQLVGARACAPPVLDPFAASSYGFLPGVGAFGVPDRGMRRGGVGAPLCRRHAVLANRLRFAGVADRCARIGEPSRDDIARYAVFAGHREHALSRFIPRHEVKGGIDAIMPGESMPLRPRGYAGPDEGLPDSFTGTSAKAASNLIKRLARGIKPLRLVDFVRSETAGHVYNLQTAEGWYSANGVIVHNCHCTAVPAFGGQPVPVRPYTPTSRTITAADRARTREWIKANL